MSERCGRTVVVTGGSRGLGAGIVQSFLDSGDRVATCARSATPEVERWRDTARGDRFLFATADLALRADCERFVGDVVERWGSIDVLVNNAGVARDGVLALFSDEDLDTVIDLNLRGTIHVTRLVVRRMLAAAAGSSTSPRSSGDRAIAGSPSTARRRPPSTG